MLGDDMLIYQGLKSDSHIAFMLNRSCRDVSVIRKCCVTSWRKGTSWGGAPTCLSTGLGELRLLASPLQPPFHIAVGSSDPFQSCPARTVN